MEEAKQIINVSVSTKQSKSDCIYENGSVNYAEQPGSGRYGFRGNILWVDRGCRAIFKVCYTGIYIGIFCLFQVHGNSPMSCLQSLQRRANFVNSYLL